MSELTFILFLRIKHDDSLNLLVSLLVWLQYETGLLSLGALFIQDLQTCSNNVTCGTAVL